MVHSPRNTIHPWNPTNRGPERQLAPGGSKRELSLGSKRKQTQSYIVVSLVETSTISQPRSYKVEEPRGLDRSSHVSEIEFEYETHCAYHHLVK